MQAVRTLRPLPQPPSELETLFAAHHARVFRTAQRITGSPADAEDVDGGGDDHRSCRIGVHNASEFSDLSF